MNKFLQHPMTLTVMTVIIVTLTGIVKVLLG